MRKEPSGRATISDVADAAGVSIKTVSRVFNDEPNVRPHTRERVMKAATELDYHPNVAARSLAGRRSFLIGLVYENPSPNYVVDLQMGALDRLRGERYRLLVLPSEGPERLRGKMIALARMSGLDGLILGPPMCDDPSITAELSAADFPFVRIAPTRDPDLSPATGIDDVAAAREMTEHLIGLGHKRIAMILGDPSHPSSIERLIGYKQALAGAGLPFDPALVEEGLYTFDSGLQAARRLLATRTRPSAIFAANDDMAAGVLMAANEAGLKVPERLSVGGFDDSHIARVVWPRLTTIRQPTYDMAHAATGALLRLIEGEGPGDRAPMPHTLVVRNSTAPPA